MANRHKTLRSLFHDIAEALRSKYETTDTFTADDFDTAILNIPAGGVDTSDATATAADILSPKTAYIADGSKATGSISSKAAATYNTSTSDQTISSGQYLSGAQTIKAVTTSNISAANIKHGVVIKVGDANDDDRIATATGSYYNDGGTYTLSSVGTKIDMGSTSSNRYVTTSGLVKPTATKAATTVTLNASTTSTTVAAGTYLSGAFKAQVSLYDWA